MVAFGALITGDAQERGANGSPRALGQGDGRQGLGIPGGSGHEMSFELREFYRVNRGSRWRQGTVRQLSYGGTVAEGAKGQLPTQSPPQF